MQKNFVDISESEFRDDIWIDEMDLTREVIHQPVLYEKYSMICVEAEMALKKAEQLLGLEKADCEYAVRDRPTEFGLEKITEKAVLAAVVSDDKVQQKEDELIHARMILKKCEGLLKSISQRKNSVELLQEQWFCKYYSEPIPKKRCRKILEEAEEKSTEDFRKKAAKKMKGRKPLKPRKGD